MDSGLRRNDGSGAALARRAGARMRPALIVFWKEVRENLRDRRTVLNTLLTGPLLAPVIFALIINGVVARELDKAERPLPVPVIGGEYAPNLVAALKQQSIEIRDAPA